MNTHADNKLQRAVQIEADPRWSRVLARDASADGEFWYSVRSTGVYCRPSCAARPARPENVEFHSSQDAARVAGFRPCKRCKPEQPSLQQQYGALVTVACRELANAQSLPPLDALAARAGLSAFHFHRVFKSVTGLTPRQYAQAHRADRIRTQLGRGGKITNAIFDAGYNSNSRFYEKSAEVLGMKPAQYRRGGAQQDIRFAIGQCTLGAVLVASTARGVCAILLGDDPDTLARDLQDRFGQANLIGGDAGFESMVAAVIGLVESPKHSLDLPLDVRGTAFQQRVWQALREIPPGTTASYTDVAHRIGQPTAVRAVAQACGANRIAVAIPCHRVVRNDGALSGYRWGVERKRELLEREGRA